MAVKKGKTLNTHIFIGQVPSERTFSGPQVRGARRNFCKNFSLYINVLRTRFGVETILADGYLDGLDKLVNGSKTS